MTNQPAESYMDHPLYRQALKNMQKGEWQNGMGQIDNLMQAYPLEHELRALRQEMLLRARVDQDEREDRNDRRFRRFWNFSVRFAVVVGLIILGLVVLRLYSNWFQEQFLMTSQAVEFQAREMGLAVKFRDAQDFLQSGRLDVAVPLLNEIATLDPNYPGLSEVKAEAERIQGLENHYNEARRLAEANDVTGALALFQEVEKQDPNYRDVQLQIGNMERQTVLGDKLARADAAFTALQWEDALDQYEELYALNPEFHSDHIEERLYQSYVNSAEVKLAGPDSLDAMQQAEDYFRKALALRPQDPDVKAKMAEARARVEERLYWSYVQAAQATLVEKPNDLEALKLADEYLTNALYLRPDDEQVKVQRTLAHSYIQAQDHFAQGLNNQVIDGLEYVYSQDKGYAKGTARQTLYEAYVARGDGSLAVGDFDSALQDYQRAAFLAEEDPGSKLRLYEVQLKLAEAMGMTGDYESAVKLYGAAVELAGLRERAASFNAPMDAALKGAEKFTQQGDYKNAWRNYRDAVAYGTETFEIVEHVVDSKDYVSSLALEYGSTISLIATLNNLQNPNIIVPGQKLLIPILP